MTANKVLNQEDLQRLERAIEIGDLAVLSALLDKAPGCIHQQLPLYDGGEVIGNFTAVCIARNTFGPLKLAIDRGLDLDINAPIRIQDSAFMPLHFAFNQLSFAIVPKLVEAGIDLTAKDELGDTAMVAIFEEMQARRYDACISKFIDAYEYLIDHGAPWSSRRGMSLEPVAAFARVQSRNETVSRIVRKGVVAGWNPNGVNLVVGDLRDLSKSEPECGIAAALDIGDYEKLMLMIEIGVNTNPVVGKTNLIDLISRDFKAFKDRIPEIQAAIMRQQLANIEPRAGAEMVVREPFRRRRSVVL